MSGIEEDRWLHELIEKATEKWKKAKDKPVELESKEEYRKAELVKRVGEETGSDILLSQEKDLLEELDKAREEEESWERRRKALEGYKSQTKH